jgi:hypothetical protein
MRLAIPIGSGHNQALDQFRTEFPSITLFDRVTVVYEKD